MNARRTLVIVIGTLCGIFAIGGLAFALGQKPPAEACSQTGITHTVVIKNSKVDTPQVHAKLCDKLTVINEDNVGRLVAFGQHDNHIAYDGVTERLLTKNQSLTVTLNKTGDYHWHDHLHDEVAGNFSVRE